MYIPEIAQESHRIEKDRAKLNKKIQEEKQHWTDENIQRAKANIQDQHHRNNASRVTSKGKPTLRLFAEGEGVVDKVSPSVKKVMDKVLEELKQFQELLKSRQA